MVSHSNVYHTLYPLRIRQLRVKTEVNGLQMVEIVLVLMILKEMVGFLSLF